MNDKTIFYEFYVNLKRILNFFMIYVNRGGSKKNLFFLQNPLTNALKCGIIYSFQ